MLTLALKDHANDSHGDESMKKCMYASDKLAMAVEALESGDEEATWLQIYGAATFCRSQGIAPAVAASVATQADLLLEMP